jgi:exopolysaccharide biosynthesis protein
VNKPLRRLGFLCALLALRIVLAAEAPGLRYEHRKAPGPLSIHILELDPRLVRIEALRALDDGVGRETVSSMAERKQALAAVNGGFFRIGGRYDGEPEGILRIGGRWFSDPATPRGALGWNSHGACIGTLGMKWWLESGRTIYPVDGINRPRGADEAILYDWVFHRSTLTDPGGREYVVSGNRVRTILGSGNAAIPAGGFVYSVGSRRMQSGAPLRAHSRVKLGYELTGAEPASPGSMGWREADNIVGGVPVLLKAGRRAFEPDSEKMRSGFALDRHPRTAVGLRSDGTWVLAAVDGRQPGLSIGMNLVELADLLASLGCVDALNLDGGGSTTCWVDGRVVNSPSDGKERPVSDSIVILRR